MSNFNAVFAAGLAANASQFGLVRAEYAKEMTKRDTENTELNGLDPAYSALVADKVAENTAVRSNLDTKRTFFNDITTKITTLQSLSPAEKATLYQAYISSGYRKKQFIDIALDMYATIISRVDVILADATLSDANRDRLITIIMDEERRLQRKNANGRTDYLLLEFTV